MEDSRSLPNGQLALAAIRYLKTGKGHASTVSVKVTRSVSGPSQNGFWETSEDGSHLCQVGFGAVGGIGCPGAVEKDPAFGKLPDLRTEDAC